MVEYPPRPDVDDPRATPPEWSAGTICVVEHGRRLLHMEGDSRNEPLCGLKRVRTYRVKYSNADELHPCPLCLAVDRGEREPGVDNANQGTELDDVEDFLGRQASEYHHGDR